MRLLVYSLMPLLILVVLVLVSCILGYFILLVIGDVVELRKIISKSTQVLLVLSIFPLSQRLKMSWTELGFAPRRQFIKQMGQGVLLGLLTLLPVLLLLYELDVHIIDESRDWTLIKAVKKIVLSLVLALLISFVEEPLFRGILLAAFRRKMTIVGAIILSSFYYAALHFLKSKTDIPYEQLNIASGFQLMAEAFVNWINPEIVSALLALWVVGIFLAIIRTEFGNSLGVCIGCHTSWVWQIKVSKDFLDTNPQSDYLYLVSSYDGVVGPLVTLWLLAPIIVYFGWKKYRR